MSEDVIGRWSEDKLELLEKYLHAYTTIMARQKKKWLKAYHYVDAFAGSVTVQARDDEARYIEGSPLRALRTEPPFDRYWFIEIEPDRLRRLESLKEKFPHRDIRILAGDSNELLQGHEICKINRESFQRGFLFLDPYGLQVQWGTIIHLSRLKAFDLFVNFSVMGVSRILKRTEEPDETAKRKINEIMGTTAWINEVYRQDPQLGLFSQPRMMRDTLRAEWLANLYVKHVHTLFEYVSRPVIMENSRNSPLYALFLASHNFTAVKVTNEIFAKYASLQKLDRGDSVD